MNKRLQTIADLITPVDVVYDVGCDHALLSIDLVQKGKANQVINFDINAAPLLSGQRNVIRANLANQIGFVQGDGLQNYVPKHLPNLVVISGLGCQSILHIVDTTPFPVPCWVLQSNNFPDTLRTEMVQRGYKITNEAVVIEKDIVYEIDVFVRETTAYHYTEQELFFGPINVKNPSLMWQIHTPELNRMKKILQYRDDPQIRQKIRWIEELQKEEKWPAGNS